MAKKETRQSRRHCLCPRLGSPLHSSKRKIDLMRERHAQRTPPGYAMRKNVAVCSLSLSLSLSLSSLCRTYFRSSFFVTREDAQASIKTRTRHSRIKRGKLPITRFPIFSFFFFLIVSFLSLSLSLSLIPLLLLLYSRRRVLVRIDLSIGNCSNNLPPPPTV